MSASKFELFRRHWLWSILVTGITLFITIYNSYLQHRSAQHEMGGSLMATYYQRSLDNRGARTIVVCMDDANVNLNGLYVTPTLDNPREFSIKDFSLSIKATCSNVELVPSSLVETHEYGGGEWLYKYKDNLLAAHDDTKRIFTDYKVSGNTGYCLLETKASYDGAATAVEYNTNVWFLVVPRKSAQSFEQWKINCKKRLLEVVSDKYYDVFYYSRTNNVERHFDIALVDNDNVADTKSTPQAIAKQTPTPALTPKKEVKTQPTPSSSKPAEVKKKPATTEKVQREEKPVKVKPASNNQDVNITKYSSSNSGKRFCIKFELDNAPSTEGKYLLYGNYTVPGNVNPYVFAYPLELFTLIKRKSYGYCISTVDSLTYHLNELRIIKETEPNGIIEITHDDGRRVIKNVTGNKIIVSIYTTYGYRNHILEKTEVIYDQKGNDNKIYVYDTGEKSTLNTNNKSSKEDKAEGVLNTILIILMFIWILVSCVGLACIINFIMELQDTESITRTLESFFSTDDFKKMPFYAKIFYVLYLISPIVTIHFVIYMIILNIKMY